MERGTVRMVLMTAMAKLILKALREQVKAKEELTDMSPVCSCWPEKKRNYRDKSGDRRCRQGDREERQIKPYFTLVLEEGP